MTEVITNEEFANDSLDQQIAAAKAEADEATAKLTALNEQKRAVFVADLATIDAEEKASAAQFAERRKAVEQAMDEAGFQPPQKAAGGFGDPKIGNGLARKLYDALNRSAKKCLTASALNNFVAADRTTTRQVIAAHPNLFSSGGNGQGAWVSLKGHERNGPDGQTPSDSPPNSVDFDEL